VEYIRVLPHNELSIDLCNHPQHNWWVVGYWQSKPIMSATAIATTTMAIALTTPTTATDGKQVQQAQQSQQQWHQ
jgi:hypothetical protein